MARINISVNISTDAYASGDVAKFDLTVGMPGPDKPGKLTLSEIDDIENRFLARIGDVRSEVLNSIDEHRQRIHKAKVAEAVAEPGNDEIPGVPDIPSDIEF